MNDEAHDSQLTRQLQRLWQALEAAGRASLPGSNLDLLQSIVDAAAQIFGAAAASIALVDDEQQELVFQVSYGIGNEHVVGMRVPLDKGLAGYVAMTGQPMAISDVQQDVRFNQDFARSTGYVPRSILATPLLRGDRVIGVMEVLDKINAPAFGMQDMELLGLFARQAAIAIDQSRQYASIRAVVVQELKQLAADESAEIIRVLDEESGDADSTRDLLAIADLFHSIAQLGDTERQACLQILSAFGDYARSKSNRFM